METIRREQIDTDLLELGDRKLHRPPGATALEQCVREVTVPPRALLTQQCHAPKPEPRTLCPPRFGCAQGSRGADATLRPVKLHSNTDAIPPQVAGWVVKPIEIDDVPIVTVTLWSDRYDDFALRRVAEELEGKLQSVPNTGRTRIVAGRSEPRTSVSENQNRARKQAVQSCNGFDPSSSAP